MDIDFNLNLGGERGDAFAIPDLWESSVYAQTPSVPPSLLFTDLDFHASCQKIEHPFQLIDLDSALFHNSTLPSQSFYDSDTPSEITSLPETDQSLATEPETDDIWQLANDFVEPNPIKYVSWDAFLNLHFKEPTTAYITEAGPGIFDAAIKLHIHASPPADGIDNILHTDVFFSSLHYLGLGRSSVLFDYDYEAKEFRPKIDKFRISGFTANTIQSLTNRFIECGNAMRNLEDFVERTYVSRSMPGLVALADAVSVVISALQARLSISPSPTDSVLQLQSLFNNPSLILACFSEVIAVATTARFDELLSALYLKIQQLEHKSGWLRDILLDVLSRVAAPWLEFVSGWIGLQREIKLEVDKEGQRNSFVKVEVKKSVDDQGLEGKEVDYELVQEFIPAFITTEDAQTVFESGKALRFLKNYHPTHPLAMVETAPSSQAPTLDWKFSWEDVERIESKSKEYEKNLAAAIKRYSKHHIAERPPFKRHLPHNDEELRVYGKTEGEIKTYISASAAAIDQPPLPLDDSPSDSLRSRIFEISSSAVASSNRDLSTFAPPISLTPLLSFCPLFSAQARLINSSCVRLFFKEHDLRSHLSLQRKFHLFGDGVFISRLSHALFDPELETAERQQGVARSGGVMGLKLGSRDSWPPASSELRLALMGVLADSYHATTSDGQEHKGGYLSRDSELPGGLSFAIRELSQEELEKCIDSHSIEALDFLRLQYKPPSPLDAIITPSTLHKYDQLFKLLLRMIRMLYVVNQLFRDITDRTRPRQSTVDPVAHKFRIEAHHFVATVSSHFFEVSVDATWAKFEAKLDEIERRIDAYDEDIGQTESLDRLGEYHEKVLDRIMFAALLRKRQEPVMKLLEDIFAIILAFAQYSRSRALGLHRRPSGDGKEMRELYLRFRKRVSVFVSVCRGLSEKRGYGHKTSEDGGATATEELFGSDSLKEEGGNTIGQLLLKLEMSGYYSEPVRRN
ncbi:hypothetical protein FGG08_007368 [Glutinoglossum americanum]|uniref:Spindle pole body component n=1 Tax=Glutinoglossum americanum TaxID=1670608 RepID=A0A9P8HZM0_9PEZI|nr:hypothetical protein FGG08_007368 [Glutinoglossum americanum]